MATIGEITPFTDIAKICRVCLLEAKNMKYIFDEMEGIDILEVNVNTFSAVITRITSIPVSALTLFLLHCTICNLDCRKRWISNFDL